MVYIYLTILSIIPLLSTPQKKIQIDSVLKIEQGVDGAPVLGSIINAAFDEDGNLYLSDANQKKIHIYSSNGSYINSLGREGKGPGEFSGLSAKGLTIDHENDQVCALDYPGARINCYSIQSHEFISTINLQSTTAVRNNGLISFQSKIFLLGSHQSVNSFIHHLDSEGNTITSFGDFINFENFTHNYSGKLQLSNVSGNTFNNLLLVSLAAPNITKLYNSNLELINTNQDNLLPTPWKTHMEMAPNSYQSTFYSMTIDNLILSEEEYLYSWSEVVDPDIPEIVFHLQLRELDTGKVIAKKRMDKDYILGMRRTSDNSALMLVRTENYKYEVQKIVIN